MKKVALIFGGKSCENEISVLTGVFALNLLDVEKYSPFPVYIHTDGKFYTSPKMNDLEVFKKGDYSSFKEIFFESGDAYAFNASKTRIKRLCRADVALNCCHGGWGEGGGVSALMEMNGIPLASPALAPSGVFMDKAFTKLVAKALNVPTVEYIRVNEKDYRRRGKFLLKAIGSRLKYPVVVKPARLGSSIGIVLANGEEETERALEAAFRLDDKAIVERFLADKRDINCAAYSLDGEIFVSEPEEAARGDKIYSFADKYLKGGEDRDFARVSAKGGNRVALNEQLREKIRSATRTIYRRMGLYGIVRMDFLVSGEEYYLGEVNTVPGSLAYYLFCERVSDAKNLFSDLIEDALKGKEEKEIVRTGILRSVRLCGKHGGVRL